MTHPRHMDPGTLERHRADLQAQIDSVNAELARRLEVATRRAKAEREERDHLARRFLIGA